MKDTKRGLWRNNPDTPEGKYLVTRRDGTIPQWPSFVLGARDPAAAFALRAYAVAAYVMGFNRQYVKDVWEAAAHFSSFREADGSSSPDSPPPKDMVDDPETVKKMKDGWSM